MALSPAAHTYNVREFSPNNVRRSHDPAQLDFNPTLHVGMPAPEISVVDLEGTPVRLADYRDRKHVVLAFGCITAPVFINDITSLNRIAARFADTDVQFFIVYVREAHPGENYQAHATMEQKVRHATDLKRLESVSFPVLVDTLDGETHHKYGLLPSPVYVARKDGLLIYKASWLIPEELELALDLLLKWEEAAKQGPRPGRFTYSELWTGLGINPAVHRRVFERTGAGAREQVTQVFGYDPTTLSMPKGD